jgi:membrane protease YdiL (CAAX protease family)
MDDRLLGMMHEQPSAASPAGRGFPTNLFLNPQGIRAGWRLLIFLAIFFALWAASIFALGVLLRPTPDVFSPSFQFFGELGSFLAAFLAAWIMSGIENRSMDAYGLPARNLFGKLFWQGSVFGLCEIAFLVGLVAAFGGYSFGRLAEHGVDVIRWAFFWGAFFLVVACFEEFLFRGYALFTLTDGIGFWPAALVLAVCFGGVHWSNPGENWIGVANVFFVGLFWSFTLKRTGSLWFALGMHASFDFGETFLFSVPDSGMVFPGHLSNATLHGPNWLTGGTPGPEASLFDFAIIALFFCVFHFLYPPKRETAVASPAPTISMHDI